MTSRLGPVLALVALVLPALLAAPADAQDEPSLFVPAGTTKRLTGVDLVATGDVVVDGTLVLDRARLVFAQSPAAPLKLHVRAGGRLEAYDSTLTTVADRLSPYPWLNVTIDGGSARFEDSVLRFPSALARPDAAFWVHASDVEFVRTRLENLTEQELDRVAWADARARDEADDGPLLVADDSRITMLASEVGHLPELGAWEWVQARPAKAGTKNAGPDAGALALARPVKVKPGETLHVVGFPNATDAVLAHLYLKYDAPPSVVAPVSVLAGVGGDLRKVGEIAASHGSRELRMDLPGVRSADLARLEVLLRNDARADISVDVLALEASWLPAESGPVFRGSTLVAVDTALDVDWQDARRAPGRANHVRLEAGTRAYFLNVTLDDAETAGVRYASAVRVDPTSELAVFRRLTLNVTSAAGDPVEGARVLLGRPGLDPAADALAAYANAALADALGHGPLEAVTDARGQVRFEAVSDVVLGDGSHDGIYVGEYEALIGIGSATARQLVALPLWPAVAAADNVVARDLALPDGIEAMSFGPRLTRLQAVVSENGHGILLVGEVAAGRVPAPAGTTVTLEVRSLATPQAEPQRMVVATGTDGTFFGHVEDPAPGKYGVVAVVEGAPAPLLTFTVAEPTLAEALTRGTVAWILTALAATVAVVVLARHLRHLRAARAPTTRVVCGHCAAAVDADAVGCDGCGALFTYSRAFCGQCGRRASDGPCEACAAQLA